VDHGLCRRRVQASAGERVPRLTNADARTWRATTAHAKMLVNRHTLNYPKEKLFFKWNMNFNP
jgi:hypothetical protein